MRAMMSRDDPRGFRRHAKARRHKLACPFVGSIFRRRLANADIKTAFLFSFIESARAPALTFTRIKRSILSAPRAIVRDCGIRPRAPLRAKDRYRIQRRRCPYAKRRAFVPHASPPIGGVTR